MQKAMIRRLRSRPCRAERPMLMAMHILCLLIFFMTMSRNSVVRADGSYSATIPYGREECLLIRIPKERHTISGSYDSLETRFSHDPVRVALYNHDEQMIWSSDFGASEGTFSQSGCIGKHWICLENGLTYEEDETITKHRGVQRVTRSIGFSLRIRKDPSGTAPNADGEAAELNNIEDTTQRLIELTNSLNDNFRSLVDHMSFMKAREIVHRELHEETFTKVVRWNILEICTVIVVTLGQVLNVWWLLSNRRSY